MEAFMQAFMEALMDGFVLVSSSLLTELGEEFR